MHASLAVLRFLSCWLNYWFGGFLPTSKVHKTSWYMIHYGGPTPKRHYAFSNSKHVARLDAGALKGWKHMKQTLQDAGQTVGLVDKYTDANGQTRWKGNKRLRSSEYDA